MKKQDSERKSGSVLPLQILLAGGPFMAGIYYEWMSCMVTLFLLGYLLFCRYKRGLRISKNSLLYAAGAMVVFYGCSTLWAVDHGMAFWGFIKFLPLPLFVIALEQTETDERSRLLESLPISGFMMVVLSCIAGMVPAVKEFFFVNERLAGFFQYPNTFALYLLLGVGVLICRAKWSWKEFVIVTGLLTGIILSGSRTVFILMGLTIVIGFFLIKEKNVKLILAGSTAILLIGAASFVIMTGNTESVGRFLTTSLSSSTLLGRLLYYKDAIPIIVKNPFGLGYLGYYYSQGSFQTGVYSVVNVHNELLQLLLDIGWIPTAFMVYAIVKGFQSASTRNRVIIGLLSLHCMVDFDLQFIAVWFILLTAVYKEEKENKIIQNRKIIAVGAGVIAVVSLYFGIASLFYYFRDYHTAAVMYPGYTNAWEELLTEAETVDEMEELADKILALNENHPLANSAKARAAYSRGDFTNVILYKQKTIRYSKYSLVEYLDFMDMLYVGEGLYRENGDARSAEQCRRYLLQVPEMIESVLEETDSLAYKITDQPELELPEEYKMMLEELNGN